MLTQKERKVARGNVLFALKMEIARRNFYYLLRYEYGVGYGVKHGDCMNFYEWFFIDKNSYSSSELYRLAGLVKAKPCDPKVLYFGMSSDLALKRLWNEAVKLAADTTTARLAMWKSGNGEIDKWGYVTDKWRERTGIGV